MPRIDNPGGMELVVEDAAGDKYSLRFRWVGAGGGLRLLPAAIWFAAKAGGEGAESAVCVCDVSLTVLHQEPAHWPSMTVGHPTDFGYITHRCWLLWLFM